MKENIICAANWYKDLPLKENFKSNFRPINCDRGVIFCAHRHAQAMYTMIAVYGLKQHEDGEEIQGFLTNKNRFVNREEGAKIFIENGGILNYSNSKLFSEDLY